MKSRFMFIMILGVLIGPTSLAADTTGQLAWKDTAPESRFCQYSSILKSVDGAANQNGDVVVGPDTAVQPK